MATVTLMGSAMQSGFPMRELHEGLNYVYSEYSLTATLSTGDVVQLMKIPHGARIVDLRVNFSVGLFPDTGTVQVGIPGSETLFVKSATCYTTRTIDCFTDAQAQTRPGYCVSVTSSSSTPYEILEVQALDAGSTGTKSGVISMICGYYMDLNKKG